MEEQSPTVQQPKNSDVPDKDKTQQKIIPSSESTHNGQH